MRLSSRPRVLPALLLIGLVLLGVVLVVRGLPPAEKAAAPVAHPEAEPSDTAASPLLDNLTAVNGGRAAATSPARAIEAPEVETAVEPTPEPAAAAPLSTVLDLRYPDGSQPDRALVQILRHVAGGRISAPEIWSPELPRLLHPENVHAVTAYAEAFENTGSMRFPSRWISEELNFPDTAPLGEVIHVELLPRQMLSVSVVDEGSDADPAPWVRIAPAVGFDRENPARSFDAYEQSGPRRMELMRQKRPGLAIIEDRFRAFDLAAGDWVVGVGREGGLTEVLSDVGVSGGETEVIVVLPAYKWNEPFRVRVVDRADQPVKGARFQLQFRRDGRVVQSSEAPATFREGEYWIGPSAFVEPAGLPGQPATQMERTLFAGTYSSGWLSETLEPDQVTCDFVLDEPTNLTASVSGWASGTFWIRAVPKDRESIGTSHGVDAGSHQVTLRLQPGEYRVELIHMTEGRGRLRFVVDSEEVLLGGRSAAVRLEVPELHELVVSAPNVRRGKMLRLRPLDGDPRSMDINAVRVDAEGKATFGAVPPGVYVLSRYPDKGPVEVTVPTAGFVYDEP